ncbi:hypothetical protein VU11_02355, partial [Desulfobulbus sp. US2]|nr:hypothetical protein [Desulfobulbus sp. US2]
MHLTVNIIERKLVCTVADRQPVFIELTDALLAEMEECCDQYHDMQMSEDAAALLTIGQTLFSLINSQPAETQLWLNAEGARRMTILAE